MSLPAVSQHLKVLERAGLIARGRDGQKRPCRLSVERLAETARWFDYTRAAWEARFEPSGTIPRCPAAGSDHGQPRRELGELSSPGDIRDPASDRPGVDLV
jgi:hypothetical protein